MNNDEQITHLPIAAGERELPQTILQQTDYTNPYVQISKAKTDEGEGPGTEPLKTAPDQADESFNFLA